MALALSFLLLREQRALEITGGIDIVVDGESKLEAKDDGFRHRPFPFERKERTLL